MAALMPMEPSLFVDFLGAYNSFLGPHSMIYGTVKTRAHKWPHGTCPSVAYKAPSALDVASYKVIASSGKM
jgi:hypothetical protein